MREILFRGKRLDNGEWVYGYYSPANIPLMGCVGHFINEGGYRAIEIDPETVGQFTGLTDKNGTKIFEGDIFKFDDEVWESCYTSCGTEYNLWEVVNYGVVGFNEESAKYDFVKYKYNENSVEADLHENNSIEFADFVSELEVIGNIQDNPELMESEVTI